VSNALGQTKEHYMDLSTLNKGLAALIPKKQEYFTAAPDQRSMNTAVNIGSAVSWGPF